MLHSDGLARNRRAAISRMRLAALLIFGSVLQACILPLPYSETLYAVPEQAAGAFVPGKSTRADVLLRLGDPSGWDERNSHLVYEWEKTRGGVVLGFPFPLLPFAGYFAASCHCLVIRFLPDELVADLKQFDGEVQSIVFPFAGTEPTCERDTALRTRVTEWLAEPLPERR